MTENGEERVLGLGLGVTERVGLGERLRLGVAEGLADRLVRVGDGVGLEDGGAELDEEPGLGAGCTVASAGAGAGRTRK